MRYYAAWICRFVSVDPLQFKYPEYTPFQYAGNKPITFVDLDGGEEKQMNDKTTQREMDKVNKKLNEKIITPLRTLNTQDVSSGDIKNAADSLAEKYQNRKWFRTFFTDGGIKTVIPKKEHREDSTGWLAKDYITINPYSLETETYTSPAERPATVDMVNTGTTKLIATPESSLSITFSPYGIPNSITVYSINSEGERNNIVEKEMFANDVLRENILMEEKDESVAGEIHYEVGNTLGSKTSDNWRMDISVSTPVFNTGREIRQMEPRKYRPTPRSFRNKSKAPM
jgi:hypothetical protein